MTLPDLSPEQIELMVERAIAAVDARGIESVDDPPLFAELPDDMQHEYRERMRVVIRSVLSDLKQWST